MDTALTQAEKLAITEKLAIIEENGGRRENILNILLALQKASGEGYINRETIDLVADRLGMTETKVFEIAAFYAMVNTKPQAKYILEVCNSTPCCFSGAEKVAEWIGGELGVPFGEATADGMFSSNFTPCVGACDIGPVIKVGDNVYGDLTREKVRDLVRDLRAEI